jgi:hypothetical protein
VVAIASIAIDVDIVELAGVRIFTQPALDCGIATEIIH